MATSASPVPSGESSAAPNLSALAGYFQISLYLLLLVSVLALVSTGKLDLVAIVVPSVALLVKGYRRSRSFGPELSARAANFLVVGYFVFFPIDLWWVSRILSADAQNPALFAALLAAVHLMLFAMIVRLYSATTTRDYLFLALLGFGNMLASAILTVDTMFLIFFFTFLVLAVSTFVGLEMRRSSEGATSPAVEAGTPAARRLHTALGITSAAIALGALLYGAGIFFLLPRFSAGFFSRFDLQPTLISGFSEDVELGQIGEIKRSGAVVMRVQVEGDHRQAENMHWRGIALTTFDGRRWYTDAHDPTAMSEATDGWIYLRDTNQAGPRYSVPLHYSVMLEPVASDALFAAAEPVRIRGELTGQPAGGARLGRRTFLVIDKTGSLSNPLHNFTTVTYDAVSEVPRVPPDLLRAAPADYDSAIRDMYLQLPKLDPRIPALARQITARASNPYDRAAAIETYLRTHYGYTLELAGTPPADPLAYFLFQRRAGHCEYFAAAMAVMLRSLGVATRYVNGFLPGEYNDLGGDYIIRARDAHSWVEVFFPGYGWITFDPTPPSNEGPPGLGARLALYWDWFELRWSEWVINYDFFHQFTLARSIQRTSRNWTGNISDTFQRARNTGMVWARGWERDLHNLPPWAFVPALFGVALILALRNASVRDRLFMRWQLKWTLFNSSRRGSLPPEAAVSAYRRMLRMLELRGWRKAPAQTPLEFAAALRDGAVREPVAHLTELYLAARFGSQAADASSFAALLAELQSVLRAPRTSS